jgi:hypothetical protein
LCQREKLRSHFSAVPGSTQRTVAVIRTIDEKRLLYDIVSLAKLAEK